jgi:hypothetical protein
LLFPAVVRRRSSAFPFLVLLFAASACGADLEDTASNDGEEIACRGDGASTLRIHLDQPEGPPVVGLGAQFNNNLYGALSRAVGITSANVGALETKVRALGPRFVRIFFDPKNYTDADRMASFVRTVALAQSTGAEILIIYWYDDNNFLDPEGSMQRFADVLADLVLKRGFSHVHYVTIKNEVNKGKNRLTGDYWVPLDLYERLYRLLDADLRAVGLRDAGHAPIRFIGGDLVGTNQQDWFGYMGGHMADLLDGYAVHVYWDVASPEYLVERLTGVKAIVDGLPPSGRKPLYVTEFGVRGVIDSGEAGPGHVEDGPPVEESPAAVLQEGWFNLLAIKLGFVAISKFDAYFAMYDHTLQLYSMIGSPQTGFALKPSYYLIQMLAGAVAPGLRAVRVEGAAAGTLVTALAGAGRVTLLGMNNLACRHTFNLRGLTAGTRLSLSTWNAAGNGLVAHGTAVVSKTGELVLHLPAKTIVALSASR